MPVKFGKHLMLDFYDCDHTALGNMALCYKALQNLSSILKMTTLVPPFVVEAQSTEHKVGGKDPGGFTGFILIAESHISLHTFPRRGFISIDVYSCKDFDEGVATDYFRKIFSPKNEEINLVNRGSFYPNENIH